MSFNTGGAASGASSGAAAGSSFGPWGTAIGAVAGGLLGGFGGGSTKSSNPVMSTAQINAAGDSTRVNNYEALRGRLWAATEYGKEYGINPLTALGAPVISGNPVEITGAEKHNPNGVDVREIGQGVERAVNAYRGKVQRQLDELALEKAQLSNDYLRTQIAGAQKAISSTASNPSFPTSSSLDVVPSVNSDRIRNVKSESVSHKKGDVGQEAASSPMWKKFHLDNDRSIMLPPNQSIEELGILMGSIKGAELINKSYDKYTPGYWLAKKRKQFSNWYKNRKTYK